MVVHGVPFLLSHLQSGKFSAFTEKKLKIKIMLKNSIFVSISHSMFFKTFVLNSLFNADAYFS